MTCSVNGCGSPAKYKGLCGKHYKRQWRHGNPETTLIDMHENNELCSVAGCNRPAKIMDLCGKHRLRLWRTGRLNITRAENGKGRPLTKAGYVLINVNGQRKYEHIYLAEKALGKPLPKGAVVHHMNEITSDNFTPFNLIVCPDQAYHRLLHRRMKDARDQNPRAYSGNDAEI